MAVKTNTRSCSKAKQKADKSSIGYSKPMKEAVWELHDKKAIYKPGPRETGVWQLQEAKAMFSEVVRAAQEKPQFVTVHGKETAVILSYEKYNNMTKPKMSLFDIFQNSPFYGIELDIPPRLAEPDRDINL